MYRKNFNTQLKVNSKIIKIKNKEVIYEFFNLILIADLKELDIFLNKHYNIINSINKDN